MSKVESSIHRLLTAGKYTLIAIIVGLALNYWGVIPLNKIPIPHLVDILYGYVILNGVSASPFIYLEKKRARVSEVVCPKCRGKLEAITNYNCPNCGKLEFQRPDD